MAFFLLFSHSTCSEFCPFLNTIPHMLPPCCLGGSPVSCGGSVGVAGTCCFYHRTIPISCPRSPPSNPLYPPSGHFHPISTQRSGSLPVFAQKMRKEYQQFIHTNSVFPKSVWKLACRNSRLGWKFGICKLLLALNRTGISLSYLSLLYCRVYKATVTHTVEFVAIQKD